MLEQAKIRVAVRIRPLLENEVKSGLQNTRVETMQNEVQVKDEKSKKTFKFDHVLNEFSSQQQVFKECDLDGLIQKVTEGYHATIFAYGQTGSGKTYTLEGSEDDGLIPKAINALFAKMSRASTHRVFKVYCSYLQLYNERIYDLLAQQKLNTAGLKLRWNLTDQFTVENLLVFECKSAEEVLNLFRHGVRNRVTASHKLNLTSSRSHSILELKVESIDLKQPDSVVTSKLELVDLAGSERINQTGAEGKSAKESIEINKSLMTLRQVIAILADSSNKSLPPFRDSKLTCLLKQSIGGNSYCLMIACLAPADLFIDENLSTLMYATKAAYITNIPIKNDDPKNRVIRDLKSQIADLRSELGKASEHISYLTQMVQSKAVNQPAKSESRILDIEAISQNIVDPINMVRELLQSNKDTREREEQAHRRCEQMQREIIELQRENFELRERLSEVEFSPSKGRSTLKRNSFIDDNGFLPEQTTQFQRNLVVNRNARAISQRSQPSGPGPQLPLLKQSLVQQFLDEEEMTNFGRRTIYQKNMK